VHVVAYYGSCFPAPSLRPAAAVLYTHGYWKKCKAVKKHERTQPLAFVGSYHTTLTSLFAHHLLLLDAVFDTHTHTRTHTHSRAPTSQCPLHAFKCQHATNPWCLCEQAVFPALQGDMRTALHQLLVHLEGGPELDVSKVLSGRYGGGLDIMR